MDPRPDPSRPVSWRGMWPGAALVLVMVAVQLPRMAQGWRDAPDGHQRIAALLVSWGCRPPGLTLPVDDAEVRQRVASLMSPDGEERVRAAHWLAGHGVRDAVPKIVSAMRDPGTRRPCQLAHSLGGLGDAAAVPDLLDAAAQPGNSDLRVCAMFALRDLASEQSIDGLLALCEDPFTARLAVDALGEIADVRALPRLHRLVDESSDPSLRRAATMALARIAVVTADDPVIVLAQRVRNDAARAQIDTWAVRWLARARDERAIGPLETAIAESRLGRSDCEALAAALLAHGSGGREALARVVSAHATENAGVAASNALSLIGSKTANPAG